MLVGEQGGVETIFSEDCNFPAYHGEADFKYVLFKFLHLISECLLKVRDDKIFERVDFQNISLKLKGLV